MCLVGCVGMKCGRRKASRRKGPRAGDRRTKPCPFGEYADRFDRWYKGQRDEARRRHRGCYAQPEGWKGFHAMEEQYLDS